MQRNWIGRSFGCEIRFKILDCSATPGLPLGCGEWQEIKIFTTRPETIFGVSFVALSPFHPLLESPLCQNFPEPLRTEIKRLRDDSKMEDLTPINSGDSLQTQKPGVALGIYVRHPFTEQPIPVLVANFVLQSYGTGAVMGVPAHDERDHHFAIQLGIPIASPVLSEPVVEGSERGEKEMDRLLINSGPFSNLCVGQGRKISFSFLQLFIFMFDKRSTNCRRECEKSKGRNR